MTVRASHLPSYTVICRHNPPSHGQYWSDTTHAQIPHPIKLPVDPQLLKCHFNLNNKLGGIIPRNIKNIVVHQWMDGLTREEIARENDIGAGTVTAIVQDARKNKECSDIDLLRQVSIRLKTEGLDLSSLALAIRLKGMMEENGINEDQLESIIQDFAAYSLRHKISCDTIIRSGREALYLEQIYGVPIEKIPEYITQGKGTLDRLEDQRMKIIAEANFARIDRDAKLQERDIIATELEKYKMEIQSLQSIRELENELKEAKRKNELYKTFERELIKEAKLFLKQCGLQPMQ